MLMMLLLLLWALKGRRDRNGNPWMGTIPSVYTQGADLRTRRATPACMLARISHRSPENPLQSTDLSAMFGLRAGNRVSPGFSGWIGAGLSAARIAWDSLTP